MTKSEIQARMHVLYEEIKANEEEIYWMESELYDLEEELEIAED